MASPSEPGDDGSSTGEGTHSAPHVSMITRRYGLESNDVRTMYTLHSMSNCAVAKASAVPHWPAPVSVVSRLMPSALL